jgi:2-polyprenyl-3-methyl-5-hydroxy-6-metoxy-1,4-benzoquinol methylase
MTCWVCGGGGSILLKKGLNINSVNSDNFNITDKNYGQHLSIFLCNKCGFKFCQEASTITKFYEEMKDEDYIEGENPRATQAKKLIDYALKWKSGSEEKLLDVGAGAGILVKEATNIGFLAEGIEPSEYLTDRARKNNINVHRGVLDDYKFSYKFDVITCIDVIEHVSDPIKLLKGIFANLEKNGIAIIVTPDIDSLMSKIMKWKWWHIRVAHVAYFNKKTLEIALNKAQLKAIHWSRPTWYFTIGYLIDRISVYLPFFKIFKVINFINKVTIPLNLGDSYSVVVNKKDK